MKPESLVAETVNFQLKNSKEDTGRVVVFKEIGIKNSYTLEASFFRAWPEPPKALTQVFVPTSTSIRYNSQLINSTLININDENLIEFGKFFAHVINHFNNNKNVYESKKIIETQGEENEEWKTEYQSRSEFTSQPKIMALKKNTGVESFMNYTKHSKMNIATLNDRTLPSVSISALRTKAERPQKTSILK